MISEISNLPPLFAAVPDPKVATETVKVSLTLSSDAKQVVLSAVDVHDNLFSTTLGEPEMSKVKPQGMEWAPFFASLIQGFNTGAVKIADNAQQGGVLCSINETAIHLPKSTNPLGSATLVDKLMAFYQVRMDPSTFEKRLEELHRKDKEARKEFASLTQEKASLESTLATNEKEKAALSKELPDLKAQLNTLLQKRIQEAPPGTDPADLEGPIDPDLDKTIARIPIPEPWHRDYDLLLLRLIKSKFSISSSMSPKNSSADKDKDKDKDKSGEKAAAGGDKASPAAPATSNEALIEPGGLHVIGVWPQAEYEKQLRALPEDGRHLIMKIMDKIDSWSYDVWTIQDFTDKGALFYTAYALFMRWNFISKFSIDEQIAINFFSQVEAGYHPNPYHNSMHGADVLHIVHYICHPGKLRDVARMTEEDCLAALIAGMIHDYDHPGLNNNFHVKVQSYLASLYNDRSILENHHCAEVFDLMKHPQLNILGSLNDSQRRDVRETIIEMVLSTDMGNHAKIFNNWKRRIGQDHDLHKKKEDQRLALAMAIKMADISNCGRPENLYLKWGAKLAVEFFLQGDNERNRGDNVSPFMDRYAPSMAKSQIAFMNYIVIPMFESIAEYLPEMHFAVDLCESNKNYWSQNDDSL